MPIFSLVDMKTGQNGKVVKIAGGRELERKLQSLGIRVGGEIKKVSSVFKHGPVTVQAAGAHVAIGYGKALRVFVDVQP